MIKVFNSDDKTYETNGNVVLNPTYANIHKEDNGDYYLDLETSIEEDKIKHIEHEEGTTIETTGTTLTDVDTTKEHKFISLYGETQQDSTTGKNLLRNDLTSQTINGLTITINDDKTIKINGTASANTWLNINSSFNFESGKTYILSGCPQNGSLATYYMYVNGQSMQDVGSGVSKTFSENITTDILIKISKNAVLSNLIFKPMLRLSNTTSDYEPYTNGASPNPDYPQPIHNVSGDNTIEICGKNLFNREKIKRNDYYNYGTSGSVPTKSVSNSRASISPTDAIEVKPLTTYSMTFPNGFRYALAQLESGYISLGDSGWKTGGTYTFTTLSTTKYIGFNFSKTDNTTITDSDWNTFINSNIQLEQGTPTEYEAYTGNSQLISLGVENLFQTPNTQTLNGITLTKNNDGTFNLSGTATANTTMYLAVNLNDTKIQNGTYTISRKGTGYNTQIDFYNGNSWLATSIYIYGNNLKATSNITIPNNATMVRFIVYVSNGTTINLTNEYVQIEKGSKANSYSEYGKPYIELNKISTYQDYIYKENDRWFLHKEIGKVIPKSSYGIQQYTNNTYIKINRPSDAETGYTSDKVLNGYCNYGKWTIENQTWNSAIQGLFTHSASTQWWLGMGSVKTSSEIDTFVADNDITIYYIVNTPTDTEITDTTLLEQLNNFEKMRLYQGITNISITPNDLTPTLKLHYNYMTGGDVVINNNDYIKSNNIIVANTPTGEQAFRITDIEKRKHKIVLKAWHISYDTKNYVIQDSYVVDKTCNQAMDHLNNATDNTSPFTTTSDIATINSYRCVRRSLFEAFNVVLERWGGHFVRDNWNFKIMNSIGQDNGVVVRYAKNLKDIQVTYDWTNVVTKILPVGNDGLLLDEVFLYADIQYDIPYTKIVHFDQNINENDYRDEQGILDEDAYLEALKNDLRSQATLYLQENYLPQVNYSLNANLEKITDIGDTIQVKDERLGVDITTNLISYDYDCILEKYTNLEFGNFTKTISDLTSYINSQTSQIVDESVSTTRITLENELETATSQIWGVLGSSYVLNEGDKILIVDSLPKETATNVIMINSAGIGFSQTGINGTFSTALTIDGTFNTSNVNVINFTADLIKGGVLKLGSNLNQNGILEVYDEANNLIAVLNKDGLRMNAVNGAYVLINQQVGFAGYDKNDNPIYWVSEDEFHMKKSVVEEEITLVDKMRIIPITITDNGTITNDGIGFVSTL